MVLSDWRVSLFDECLNFRLIHHSKWKSDCKSKDQSQKFWSKNFVSFLKHASAVCISLLIVIRRFENSESVM